MEFPDSDPIVTKFIDEFESLTLNDPKKCTHTLDSDHFILSREHVEVNKKHGKYADTWVAHYFCIDCGMLCSAYCTTKKVLDVTDNVFQFVKKNNLSPSGIENDYWAMNGLDVYVKRVRLMLEYIFKRKYNLDDICLKKAKSIVTGPRPLDLRKCRSKRARIYVKIAELLYCDHNSM